MNAARVLITENGAEAPMAAIRRFLATQPLRMFVGGKWVGSESGETLHVLDPGTAKHLAKVAAGGAA